jgi:hypothetical protein
MLEGVIEQQKPPRPRRGGGCEKIVLCMSAVICIQYMKATITGSRGVIEEPLPNRDDISRLG